MVGSVPQLKLRDFTTTVPLINVLTSDLIIAVVDVVSPVIASLPVAVMIGNVVIFS